MDLTDVSKTALGTMRCHVIEAKKAFPLLRDPMAIYAYDKLLSLVGKGSNDQILSRKIPTTLINHIVLRARKYDQIINEYIKDNESVTIVNIG